MFDFRFLPIKTLDYLIPIVLCDLLNLCSIQSVICTLLLHEFLVVSYLGDAAVIYIHDLITVSDGGQTVCYDEGSPALKHGGGSYEIQA